MDPEAAELFKAAFGDLGEPGSNRGRRRSEEMCVARRQPGFVPMLARRSKSVALARTFVPLPTAAPCWA
jgi:hypothetical protein